MSEPSEPIRAPVTTAKASRREVDRRRSDRLLITVPIRVEGVDRNGVKFAEETRTIFINRQGARISLQHPVASGAMLRIIAAGGRRSAMFRIVGPTQPVSADGCEWGVECQDSSNNMWGIGFPPVADGKVWSSALIECRRCHAVKLSHLSMVEHEVMGSSGLLVKECEVCGRSTSWGYKENMALPGDDGDSLLPSTESFTDPHDSSDRRTNNRVAVQLPVRIRSFFGSEEFSRTENVSRSGICFITERIYEIGEIILVTCPYEPGGHNNEVRARVARRREMQGTSRKIYGVYYER